MSYKIAIGSSNGTFVDLKFGEVKRFFIYEVEKEAKLIEIRDVVDGETDKADNATIPCGNQNRLNEAGNGCGGQSSGCGGQGSGCGGHGNGCGGAEDVISKVSTIADCRCVVCKKIGFQAQKQFEKKAISVFDVECPVEEALEKISFYYNKMDRHESFRKG